jgi:bifunctional non-homologous end joining protein LigD
VSPDARKVAVQVDGRTLMLSNLDKVLYPAAGFSKAQVIDYYLRIAPVMLPHLAGRPVTIKRYPEGVDGQFFYQKNVPAGLPDWVPTARIATPGSAKARESIEYILGGDLPVLIWAANLAALELHTPMWRYPQAGQPDLLVFDLDPGPPATVLECCQVALLLRPLLTQRGLQPVAKTSGGKGMQLYAAVSQQRSGQGTGRATRGRASRAGGVTNDESTASWQGADRLEPEQCGQDHGDAVLAQGPAAADCLRAGHLGRGDGVPAG